MKSCSRYSEIFVDFFSCTLYFSPTLVYKRGIGMTDRILWATIVIIILSSLTYGTNASACNYTLTDIVGGSNIEAAEFSYDYKYLAVTHGKFVKIYNTADWSIHRIIKAHTRSIVDLVFSPRNYTLATTAKDGNIKLWNADTGVLSKTMNMSNVNALAFDQHGYKLATGSDDGRLFTWSVSSGTVDEGFIGLYSADIVAVAFGRGSQFSPGGTRIIAATSSQIKAWETSYGNVLDTYYGFSASRKALESSPDTSVLAVGGADGALELFDTYTGSSLGEFFGHIGDIKDIAFSPDGTMLATASSDKTVKVWEISSQNLLYTFEGHTSYVYAVAFSENGATLVSGGLDSRLLEWDLSDGTLKTTIEEKFRSRSVAFSPDGTTFATGGYTDVVNVINVADRTIIKSLEGHTGAIFSVVYSPDGTKIASASQDDTIKIWNISDGVLLHTLTGHTDDVQSVAFSPNGTTLASGAEDGKIKLWTVSDGTLVDTITAHSGGVFSVAFSPDGTSLASGGGDKKIKLWDLSNNSLVYYVTGSSSNNVNSVTFSSDGKTIASGAADSTVRLWQASNGALQDTYTSHTSAVNHVEFLGNSTTLASSSPYGELILWRTSDGDILDNYDHKSYSVAFSPDGTTFVSADGVSNEIWYDTGCKLTNLHLDTAENYTCGTGEKTFTWSSTENWEYKIMINGYTAENFINEETVTIPGDYSYQPNNTWQISARTYTGYEVLSDIGAFDVSPGAKPVLVTKSDATCADASMLSLDYYNFEWSDVGALEYDFVLNGEILHESIAEFSASIDENYIFKLDNVWSVVARDCLGERTISNIDVFSVAPLATPVELVAHDDFTCDNSIANQQKFLWNDIGHLEYDFVLNGQVIEQGITDTEFTIPARYDYERNNTWSVIARDCVDAETESASGSFSLTSEVVPVQPALISPANNETLYCGGTLKWDRSANHSDANYILRIYSTTDLENPVLDLNVGTWSEYSFSEDTRLESGTYRWRVAATNCVGVEEALSAQRQFIVDNAPPAPVLSVPTLDEWMTSTPTFSWTNVGAASNVVYDLFVDYHIVASNIETTSYQLPANKALSHGNHSWYVKAYGCNYASSISGNARSFRVDTQAPSAFELTAPEETEWFSKENITFEWSEPTEGPDEGIGTKACTVMIDGEQVAEIDAPATSWNSIIHLTLFDEQFTSTSVNSGRWEAFSGYITTYANNEPSEPYSLNLDGTDYASSVNVDLTDAFSATLSYYWSRASTESGDDLAVGYWTGYNWEYLTGHFYNEGSASTFYYNEVAIPNVDYDSSFKFRFQAACDSSSDDYYIDDIKLDITKGLPLTDGSHDWYVVCRDEYDNERESNTHRTLLVDRTAPLAATLVSPAYNSYTNDATPTFTWQAGFDETSGMAGYEVWFGAEKMSGDVLIPADTTSWAPDSDLEDGEYRWKVVTIDRAGNSKASSSWTIFIDHTPPTTPVSMTPEGISGQFQFCWTDSLDAGSGVCNYEIWIDGSQEYSDIGINDARRSAEGCVDFYNFYDDGPHSWYLIIEDCAGNSHQTDAVAFTLETMPPESFFAIEPAQGTTINTLNPLFCWNEANDTGSGIDHYDLIIDNELNQVVSGSAVVDGKLCSRANAELSNGNHTWQVYAYDGANNQRKASNMPWGITVDQDIYPPTSTITTPEAGAFVSCAEYEFSGLTEDIGSDGKLGSGIEKIEVQIDSTTGTWQEASLTGTEYHQSWTYNAWDGSTGDHTIFVRAVDREGNVQDPPSSVSFETDCSGPLDFDLIEPSNMAYSKSCPAFSWESTTDSPLGMSNYDLILTEQASGNEIIYDTGLNTSLTLSGEECLADGIYNWYVKAYDTLGNETNSLSSRTIYIDTTGPVGFPLLQQDAVNSEGWVTSCRTVTLSWSPASDDGYSGGVGMHETAAYQFMLNGNPLGERQTTTSKVLTNLEDGHYTWTVRAFDKLDNWTDSTVVAPLGEFNVDCTSPELTEVVSRRLYANNVPTYPEKHASTPLDTGLYVSEGETIRISATGELCFTDDASCDPILRQYGFCMGPEGNDNPYGSFSKFYQQFAFGRVVASIDGYEIEPLDVGNESVIIAPHSGYLLLAVNDNDDYNCASKWDEITIQRENGFNLLFPVDNTLVSNPQPTLEWSEVTDHGVGVERIEVVVDEIVVEGNLSPDTTTYTILPEAELVEGDHTWKVRAYDSLGNVASSDEWTIRVDLTPPEPFVITEPAEGDYVLTKTPNLCWEGTTDSRSDIAHYLVFLDDQYNTSQYPDTTCITPQNPLEEGEHCFTVKARDELRHERTSTNIRCFVVDTVLPDEFSLISPEDGFESYTAQPEFCWETSDDESSGIQRYEIWLSGNLVKTVEQPQISPMPSQICWQAENVLNNGTYDWFVKAINGAEAVVQTEAWQITINRDIDPPEVLIVSPVDDELFGPGGIVMEGEVTDLPVGKNTGVAKVDVFDQNNPNNAMDATVNVETGYWNLTWPVENSGDLTLCARGWDNENNINEATGPYAYPCVTVRVQMDLPLPFVINNPTNNQWTGRRPTFTWNSTEDLPSVVTHYYVKIAGLPDIDAGTQTSYELSELEALADGNYSWTVSAVDSFGNERYADNTESFRVDGLEPNVATLVSPNDGAWLNDQQPELCWYPAFDNGSSGIKQYRIRIDGEEYFVGSDVNCYSPASALSESAHLWDVAAIDNAGNHGQVSNSRAVHIDATAPPTPSATYPDNNVFTKENPPVFNWLAVSDLPVSAASGVAAYIIKLNGVEHEVDSSANTLTWPVQLADGTYNWTLSVRDNAGNESIPTETRILNVGNVEIFPPVLTSPIADSWLNVSKPTITWQASAGAANGVCAYVLTVDGDTIETDSTTLSYTLVSELEEGTHTIVLETKDCEGYTSNPVSCSFNIDRTGPLTPSLIEPANGICLNNRKPLLQWDAVHDTLSGVAQVEIKVDDVVVATGEQNTTSVQITESLNEGAHQWQVVARDLAGNYSSSNIWSFVVDLTIPDITVTTLADGDDTTKFTVSGSAMGSDACGLLMVQLKIDDGEWIDAEPDEEDGFENWQAIVDRPKEGEHTLIARSIDAAGNLSENANLTAIFDSCNDLGECDEETNVCSVAKADNSVCDDNNACTQSDTCHSGICEGVDNVVCEALDQCHVPGECIAETGECSNPEVADNSACNLDSDGCTFNDVCLSGVCTEGSKPDCSSDDDQCNVGTCKSTGVNTYLCVKDPTGMNGLSCNADSDGCTVDDLCSSGTCLAGTAADCTGQSNQCNSGVCQSSGNNSYVCVKDSTNFEGVACDDLSLCTDSDVCTNGECLGTEKDCSDGIVCTFDACNPETGQCEIQADNDMCDDQNDCTTDVCVADAGCEYNALSDWSACENLTTKACFEGVCESLGENDSCEDYIALAAGTLFEGALDKHHTYINASLACNEDGLVGVDAFFYFEYDNNTTYSVTIDPEGDLDLAVVVWSDCDTNAQCLQSLNDGGAGETEVIENLHTDESGKIILQVIDVTTAENKGTKNYTVLIESPQIVDGDLDDVEGETDTDDDIELTDNESEIDGDTDSFDNELDAELDHESDADSEKEEPIIDGDEDSDTIQDQEQASCGSTSSDGTGFMVFSVILLALVLVRNRKRLLAGADIEEISQR